MKILLSGLCSLLVLQGVALASPRAASCHIAPQFFYDVHEEDSGLRLVRRYFERFHASPEMTSLDFSSRACEGENCSVAFATADGEGVVLNVNPEGEAISVVDARYFSGPVLCDRE